MDAQFGDTLFMAQVQFETGDLRYAWLNETLAVRKLGNLNGCGVSNVRHVARVRLLGITAAEERSQLGQSETRWSKERVSNRSDGDLRRGAVVGKVNMNAHRLPAAAWQRCVRRAH